MKDLEPNQRIGNYRVVRRIGRGFIGPANLCIGGISDPNVWGIHDIWLDGWTQWTCDLYDF